MRPWIIAVYEDGILLATRRWRDIFSGWTILEGGDPLANDPALYEYKRTVLWDRCLAGKNCWESTDETALSRTLKSRKRPFGSRGSAEGFCFALTTGPRSKRDGKPEVSARKRILRPEKHWRPSARSWGTDSGRSSDVTAWDGARRSLRRWVGVVGTTPAAARRAGPASRGRGTDCHSAGSRCSRDGRG